MGRDGHKDVGLTKRRAASEVDWTYTSDIHVYIIVRGTTLLCKRLRGAGECCGGWGMTGAILTRLSVYGEIVCRRTPT